MSLYPRLDNPSVNLSASPGRVLRVDWSCRTFVISTTRDKDADVIPQLLSSEVYRSLHLAFLIPNHFWYRWRAWWIPGKCIAKPLLHLQSESLKIRQQLFVSNAFVHFFHRDAHTILVFSNSKRAMPGTVWP